MAPVNGLQDKLPGRASGSLTSPWLGQTRERLSRGHSAISNKFYSDYNVLYT